jgi:hypothetical protein
LFAIMIFTMFIAVSSRPGMTDGKLASMEFFMDGGWESMGITADAGKWMLLPAQIGMAFGFLLPSTKLVHAMTSSKLIPDCMGLNGSANHRKVLPLTLITSLVICLIAVYVPEFDVTNLPILFAMFTYQSDLYAYYKLHSDFGTAERMFRSPFGLVATVLASLLFILCAVDILFVEFSVFTFVFFFLYVGFVTIYYYFYAKTRQVLSESEQKTLLTLHIIQNNRRKRKQVQHVVGSVRMYMTVRSGNSSRSVSVAHTSTIANYGKHQDSSIISPRRPSEDLSRANH